MKSMKPLRKKKIGRNVKPQEPDARVAPIIDAIKEATLVFREENALLEDGVVADLSDFIEKKREAEKGIKKAGVAAQNDGFSLVAGSIEAKEIENALAGMNEEVSRNASYLQGTHAGLSQISKMMKRIVSDKGSEGMYNRRASPIKSSNKMMIGLDASI